MVVLVAVQSNLELTSDDSHTKDNNENDSFKWKDEYYHIIQYGLP